MSRKHIWKTIHWKIKLNRIIHKFSNGSITEITSSIHMYIIYFIKKKINCDFTVYVTSRKGSGAMPGDNRPWRWLMIFIIKLENLLLMTCYRYLVYESFVRLVMKWHLLISKNMESLHFFIRNLNFDLHSNDKFCRSIAHSDSNNENSTNIQRLYVFLINIYIQIT